MHTITLKSDNTFYEMLNEMVRSLGTTRSELIRKAVISYKKELEKEVLKKQIKEASFKVRADALDATTAFDDTLDDGLQGV